VDAAPWLSSAVCTPGAAAGTTPLIDNLDDKDGIIPRNEGRSGVWYTYNDGTGKQTPVPDTDDCHTFTAPTGKACTSGSNFAVWGAGIGVVLNQGAGPSWCAYDVSAYQGVRFTMSGTIASGRIVFMAVTVPGQTVEFGGSCTAKCDDSYAKGLEIDSAPQTYEIAFADLKQGGWGTAFAWNPAEVMQFLWGILPINGADGQPSGPVSFSNVCVDNLEFY
jgi:hypothetical protein